MGIHEKNMPLRGRNANYVHCGCQVLTLIHECTHFTDVFDSTDDMYGVKVGLSFWAQDNPEKALRNADSLTCNVGFKV